MVWRNGPNNEQLCESRCACRCPDRWQQISRSQPRARGALNLDGEIYAIEDVCTHDSGPLVEGTIVNGCQVQCPRHGARFDIRTGAALSFPAFEPTNTYAVQLRDGEIWIERPQ